MNDRVEVHTSSRLHFGLLGWGPENPRQYGGVGLLVDSPGIAVVARRGQEWRAEGPQTARVLTVAERVAKRIGAGSEFRAAFEVRTAAREHAGLGTGTQLSLAVAQCVRLLAGHAPACARELAALAGRSPRSGVGIHGFDRGGLIVDGGKARGDDVPPLLAHHIFPREWHVLLMIPRLEPGTYGAAEDEAFAKLPPAPAALVDRLCRLVLLGILPAVVERDLMSFGQALTELQCRVGALFAGAQSGGLYAHPVLSRIVEELRGLGFHGVGQSSWGPTLYAFTDRDPADFDREIADLRARFELGSDELIWTQASETGTRVMVGGTER